ncbi:MAG: SDR family NAD(P)-dependent oxidoreductase [Rubrivivax sp.]|nr:SDR family NAD(P)-dependent oxidoreductase [Rubrivivax sp.]
MERAGHELCAPVEHAGRLAGRKAQITGASHRIARAIEQAHAAEGADVFLVAPRLDALQLTQAPVQVAAGQAHVQQPCDVRDRGAAQAMVERAMALMGGINILVNNAGVYHAARFIDIEPQDFGRVLQVNVCGAFPVLQAVLRTMHRVGRGRAVNIAATAGKRAR